MALYHSWMGSWMGSAKIDLAAVASAAPGRSPQQAFIFYDIYIYIYIIYIYILIYVWTYMDINGYKWIYKWMYMDTYGY